MSSMSVDLEAFAVDDGRSGFVVFGLADPHGLEGGQRRQDGATDPYGVFALGRSDDLDLHGWWGQSGDFLLHTISNTGVHGGAAGQHSVGVQVLTDVDVALHDGVEGGLVDTSRFHTQEGWLEQRLWATETLVTDGDDLTVGKLVALLQGGGGGGGGHLLLEVQGDVAQLLLDVTDDLTLGGGGERVTTLGQDLHQVVGQVTTSQVHTHDSVGEGVTFVDGDCVGDTISGVEHDTSGTTGSVQGQHSLDTDVLGRGVEGLEHDLCHLLAVSLGVEGGLCQQYGVLLGGHTELVVEGVMPDLLHVVPVGDDAVLDGVLEGEDTTLALGLITHVGVLLTHTHHHTLMPGAADDGGEHGSGGVVAGEASFAHTGPIVDDEGGYIFVVVAHLGLVFGSGREVFNPTQARAQV